MFLVNVSGRSDSMRPHSARSAASMRRRENDPIDGNSMLGVHTHIHTRIHRSVSDISTVT